MSKISKISLQRLLAKSEITAEEVDLFLKNYLSKVIDENKNEGQIELIQEKLIQLNKDLLKILPDFKNKIKQFDKIINKFNKEIDKINY